MISFGYRIVEEYEGEHCTINPVFRNYDDAKREIYRIIKHISPSVKYVAYILQERYEEVFDDNGFLVGSSYTKKRYENGYYVNDNGKIKYKCFNDSNIRPSIILNEVK